MSSFCFETNSQPRRAEGTWVESSQWAEMHFLNSFKIALLGDSRMLRVSVTNGPVVCPYRIPLFYEMKLLLIIWMIVPQFKVRKSPEGACAAPSCVHVGCRVVSERPLPPVPSGGCPCFLFCCRVAHQPPAPVVSCNTKLCRDRKGFCISCVKSELVDTWQLHKCVQACLPPLPQSGLQVCTHLLMDRVVVLPGSQGSL